MHPRNPVPCDLVRPFPTHLFQKLFLVYITAVVEAASEIKHFNLVRGPMYSAGIIVIAFRRKLPGCLSPWTAGKAA